MITDATLPCCANCRFYQELHYADGNCRRHAPAAPLLVTTGQEGGWHNAKGQWPQTGERDWCGDFERKLRATDDK